jgi:N6-adenosine-specific RNA methylase IME4
VLLLWKVASQTEEAYRVVRAWGFEPKSEVVWCKPAIGMGRTVRNAHETCIVAARGNYSKLVKDHGVPSWFTAPRGKHSAKPDEFYALVERLFEGPYYELFARRRREGWQCFGKELT